MDLVWTQSNGGPLLVLNEEALPLWQGVTNEGDPTDPATHYGQACEVQGPAGLVDLGSGQAGLVLGDDTSLPAAVLGVESGFAILRTYHHPTQPVPVDELLAAGKGQPSWEGGFQVGPSGRLLLFDSALAGAEVDTPPDPRWESRLPTLRFSCSPGRYRVVSYYVVPGVYEHEAWVHGVRPVAS